MPVLDASWLIYVGAALLLLAYGIRDELRLRILIVASTFVYIAYYYILPSGPLWEPIVTSVLIVGVNLWVVGQVLLERTTLRLSDDEKRLFEGLEPLTPGQFRRMLKITHWQTADDPDGTILTRENEPSDELFYILEGTISVQKGEHVFRLPEGNFVGEVAFVMNRQTTATTVAPQGVRFVQWNAAALRKLSEKHPNFGNALNALLTCDLAQKLTKSYRPDDALPANRETVELLEAVDA